MNRTKYLKGNCQACGGRIEFPAEGIGTTIDCPHCGQSTELMLETLPDEPTIPRRTIIWTLSTVLILLLGLAGAMIALKRAQNRATHKNQTTVVTNSIPPQPTPEPISPAPVSSAPISSAPVSNAAPADPAALAGFRVSQVKLEKTPGSSLVYAVGILTNPAARQRFGVKIEVDLLDRSGQKIGTAMDYQQVLEPKANWNFRALVVASKAASARVAAIQEQK